VVDLLGHFTDSCWNRFLKTDRAEGIEITNRLDLCLGSSLAYRHLDVSSPFRSEEWFDLSASGHFKSNFLCSPSNIAFKILFAKYQPTSKKKMDTITGAGSMIGFLERLVIGACLIYGQFASIGLVFTAKSIARSCLFTWLFGIMDQVEN